MNYIANSKNRKLKNKIHAVINRLSFNFLYLSGSRKIIGIGVVIALVSLFINWFSILDNSVTSNAFSIHAGFIGYIILIILATLIFLLLSERNKEKMKTKAHFTVSDHAIVIFSGITIFLLTFVVFNSIRGFVLFYQNITIGNGIIFEFIGSIFIFIGGIFYYREKKSELLKTMYVENSQASASILEEYEDILKKNEPNKKNMTLPI